MSIISLIDQTKANYENILKFLEEEEEDKSKEGSKNINQKFQDIKLRKNPHEIRLFFRMFVKIYNNHKNNSNAFTKFVQILKYFQEEIQKFYSNSELFDIFKINKRILLFLIQEKMIIFDNYIFSTITSWKYLKTKYYQYFLPEIKPFVTESWISRQPKESEDMIKELKSELPENFNENREIGQNENYICKLIREDLVIDFISYVNRTNYPLNSKINPSIYETDPFLIKKQYSKDKISLIEYAAFYGSIQIFQYLKMNNVNLTYSLWLYSIHSNNPELIHLLEENQIVLNEDSYLVCYYESIKCHHNDIANYIMDVYLNYKKDKDIDDTYQLLKYYNFSFIQNEFINHDCFYALCRYDYYRFVSLFLIDSDLDINKKTVLNSII